MFTKEALSVMTKEELSEAVMSLQLKVEALEKENQELKLMAEIGKKYQEELKNEAVRLVKLVDESSPILKLLDKADIETLKAIVEEYREKAKQEYKPSSKQAFTEEITEETIEKMSYEDLLKLKEKFSKEVE